MVMCPCNAGELAPLQLIREVLLHCYTHHLKVGVEWGVWGVGWSGGGVGVGCGGVGGGTSS